MRYSRAWAVLCIGLLLPAISLDLAQSRAGAQADPFASPLFERVWQRTDAPVAAGVARRSWTWGPAPIPAQSETFAGAPGGVRQVQYFDKGRMEVNPAVSDPASPWAATSGLLVVELVSGLMQTGPAEFEARAPADLPVAGEPPTPADRTVATYRGFASVASLPGGPDRRVPPNTRPVNATMSRNGPGTAPLNKLDDVLNVAYIPQTGHNVPDVFWSFMHSQGFVAGTGGYEFRQLFDPVFVLGYPISEAYWTTAIIDGKPKRVLVQLYQRRVLTYVPGFPTAWQVQMGNVGRDYYAWRYGRPMLLPAAAPAVPMPPRLPVDAFVSVQGDKLMLGGAPVVLKGTNYWLHTTPFVDTWGAWDGPAVAAELAKAHALGANSLRISLPYIHSSIDLVWGDKQSERVNGPIINLMTQLLQIASSYDMKVMFVLFDGTDRIEDPDSGEFRQELNYVQGIVEPFAADDRVLAWDLHNEPDNAPIWKKGAPDVVIRWLKNIAGAVRASDPHHPITVGMGSYDNLWYAPAGAQVLDFVDFASFHGYDAGRISDQIATVKQHTSRPVVLSEFGWPTGPASESSPKATFDEPTQQFLYRTMLSAARSAGIAGVMQWTLWDYTTVVRPAHEAHFGLVRNGGSFKPAASDFRDGYTAPPLPSLTQSALPLTGAGVEPEIGP